MVSGATEQDVAVSKLLDLPDGDIDALMASGVDDVRALHAEVDEALLPLVRRHATRLRCERGCHACCVDDLTVFEVEAERIRQTYPTLLAEERPAPIGSCAFLDAEGACRIYDARPYVCRTQGLPLRWLDVNEGGDPVEFRDICPLNEHGEESANESQSQSGHAAGDATPVEKLDADDCWELGPIEGRLATLQRAATPQADPITRRVALRELFHHAD